MGNIRPIIKISDHYSSEIAATNREETTTRPRIDRRAEGIAELIENRISIIKYGVLGSVSFALFLNGFHSTIPVVGSMLLYGNVSLCLYSGIKFTLGIKKDYSLLKNYSLFNSPRIGLFSILGIVFNQ